MNNNINNAPSIDTNVNNSINNINTNNTIENHNSVPNNTNINAKQNEEKRKDKDKPIIYTALEKKETKQNNYDIDVHIPYINIDNEIIEKYNNEIENTFITKVNNILKAENKNENFTVEYTANVEYDIISIIIKAKLKEGSNAQRIIIQTYNYDLRNNKEISRVQKIKSKGAYIWNTQKKLWNILPILTMSASLTTQTE